LVYIPLREITTDIEKLKWPASRDKHEMMRFLACVPTIRVSQLKQWTIQAADKTYGRILEVSMASKPEEAL
jgi:hypothetical protein